MFCVNPIYIEGRGIFPCGLCRFCRMMRQEQWAMRMMHEKVYWNKSVFVTLTYNNNNLPEDGMLDKEELQKFLKRIRRAIEPDKIKYYACGEYGETFGRPHYHLIIFGLGCSDRKIIEKAWPYGFNKVEGVTRQTCKYVAKYVTKALLGRSKRESDRLGKAASFQICSRGLGLRWLEENIEKVGKEGIHYHGRKKSVPRYYIEKGKQAGLSYQSVEDLKAQRVQDNHKLIQKWIDEGLNGAQMSKRREDQRKMRIEELRTKDEMYKAKDDL